MLRNEKFVLIFFTPYRTHRVVFECKYSSDTELQYFLLFIVSQPLLFSIHVTKAKAQHRTITRALYSRHCRTYEKLIRTIFKLYFVLQIYGFSY
jgi:hypothetical protein